MYNIQIWGMCISPNLDFLRLPVSNFLLPLSFLFSRPLLLSLPFVFHILPGCCKKVACYGQSLEMGPGSVIGIIMITGHNYDHSALSKCIIMIIAHNHSA